MTQDTLNQAMNAIRSIDSAQYGYPKYKTRIESCFSKIREDDMAKLAEYGLFQLSVQDDASQDALLTAFRAGFLSPKQQKATGQKVASVPTASVPTTAYDFLSRRLDAALRVFSDLNHETLTSGLGPHSLVWQWEGLMLDADFVGDYAAIAEYESRFSRFIASLPYTPTGWKPVSDSHIEVSIGLAEFSAIKPMPDSARFEDGKMLWIVPVKDVPLPEPTPVTEPTPAKVTPAKAKVTK